MTDTSGPTDDMADLRAAVAALTARLDQVEAQAARPTAATTARAWLSGARDALHDPQAQGPADSPRMRWLRLGPVLTLCAVLLALILAVELTDEVLDGVWHASDWID